MPNEIFAVGVGGVFFHNGVVVIELAGLSATEKDEKGRPKREITNRIIMTPTGMLESMEAMKGMVEKLVEVGFLKKNEKAGQAKPEADKTSF